MPDGELGVGRDHPELLLLVEDALALDVPAVVELAGVLVRPLLRHVVRCVRRTGGEVDEERLVRHQRLLLPHPAAGTVGEVLGQVVALLLGGRRLDGRRSVVQRRVPLVVLAADEAVEGLEPTAARGPGVERPHRRGLPHRHLVALAELGRGVAVQLQRHRQRRLGVRPQRAVARRRGGGLGDAAHPDRVVVAPGQQCLPGRRAQRSGVEPVVLQAAGRQPLGSRRAGTVHRTRSRHRSPRRPAARPARSGHPPAEAAARSAGTPCPGPSRRTSSDPEPVGRGSAACRGSAGLGSWSSFGSQAARSVSDSDTTERTTRDRPLAHPQRTIPRRLRPRDSPGTSRSRRGRRSGRRGR